MHTPIYTYIRVGIISRRCRQCRILDRRDRPRAAGIVRLFNVANWAKRVRCVVTINQGHSHTFRHIRIYDTHIYTLTWLSTILFKGGHTTRRRRRSFVSSFVARTSTPSFLRFFCTSPREGGRNPRRIVHFVVLNAEESWKQRTLVHDERSYRR